MLPLFTRCFVSGLLAYFAWLVPGVVAQPSPSPLAMAAVPTASSSTPAGLAVALSELLYDTIPRHYEKKKDWNRQKAITVGLRTEGNGLNLRIRRRKKEVDHGTWKHYRISMLEPEKHLDVRVVNLRSLDAGQIAFSLLFSSRLEGSARARVYNRGVHVISLSAEGHSLLRLWLDCEVCLQLTPGSMLTGVEVVPRVTDARLELDDFQLTRISKAKGPLVRELGKGLRYLIEEELEGPQLVAKLNRAIEKKRDRLRFTPETLLRLADTSPTD